ncbi:uncharacterized protein LOC125353512 [Perognathus longimembris pacificus]|uniref:uncharacterized protein LOC125353512 n=1 Tax=Perognathus longimembris pacificus TaxID=214514 RepID=UPI0020186950|nr:uncharacterized protein LOC125353512 [Perognathus longimembris pacificus]
MAGKLIESSFSIVVGVDSRLWWAELSGRSCSEIHTTYLPNCFRPPHLEVVYQQFSNWIPHKTKCLQEIKIAGSLILFIHVTPIERGRGGSWFLTNHASAGLTRGSVAGKLCSARTQRRPRLLRWRLSSSFQVLHCGGPNRRRRTSCGHTPGGRPATPARPLPSPCGLANGGATNGTTCSGLAVSGCTVPGSTSLEREAGRRCWRLWGDGFCTSSNLSPRNLRTTAEPVGSEIWRAAPALWVYAALFCPVTDALEMKFMTSSRRPANRNCSRGEAFLPLRLRRFKRVSARARAVGVGEVWSWVARMSGEAPPPRLYIKDWRGARRRHFALEWSGL